MNGYNDVLRYNPFRYRGYVYDKDTKLYFLESRYYCPETHRFMSPDHPSYTDLDNLNCLDLYAYCGNDPVNYVDPSGHIALIATIVSSIVSLLVDVAVSAAVGAVLGAAIGGIFGGISALANGQRGWNVLGGIGIGMLTGAIMGAGAGAAGPLINAGGAALLVGMAIGLSSGAIGGTLNETFAQLLYNNKIVDPMAILINAGKGMASNLLASFIGAGSGCLTSINSSFENIVYANIGYGPFCSLVTIIGFVADYFYDKVIKNKR